MKPRLKRSRYSFDQWMRSIPQGKTPDGKNIARISFFEPDDDYLLLNWREVRVIGNITLVEAGDHHATVHLRPGSIYHFQDPYQGDMNNRTGYILRMCPLE